jgi:hypothetical protein
VIEALWICAQQVFVGSPDLRGVGPVEMLRTNLDNPSSATISHLRAMGARQTSSGNGESAGKT